MKMVKSLLLGSAAGLVAIAGAQAVDLSDTAKPVHHVAKGDHPQGQTGHYVSRLNSG